MTKKTFSFSSASVDYYFNAPFSFLPDIVDKERSIIITDTNVFARHKRAFTGWRSIVIKAGESFKIQATVDEIIEKLIEMQADRKSVLVGVGGGVVTDITGYVAGVYMRGVKFGFVPTSILAMVDAAIGGKNGIDVGVYKNIVGLIRQPSFLVFDFSFLKSLPKEEWINGFAEVIKHACIKDKSMFKTLEENTIGSFKKNEQLLMKLIQQNVLIKTKVVIADEFETGERKFLNFGHTLGHAIENLYGIPHGHAVSIGMGVAMQISEEVTGFKETARVKALLKRYGLPPEFDFDKPKALKILRADKKKDNNSITYVLLDKIGQAHMVTLSFDELEQMVHQLNSIQNS